MMNTKHKHIFICGLHRSGTSLLHKIFSEHPCISGFKDTNVPEDEGQHLQNIFPAAKEFGGPGKFCFNKKSFMNENHPLATEINAEKLFSQWSEYWDLDKKYLLEKSPPNIVRSRFLQNIFPDSYFIFITRDPIATSMATQKWSNNSALDLYKHWDIAHKTMLNDVKYLSNYKIIKYEDMVSDPQRIVGELFDFLNLEQIEINQNVKQNVNNHYYDIWKEYLHFHIIEKLLLSIKSNKVAKQLGYA